MEPFKLQNSERPKLPLISPGLATAERRWSVAFLPAIPRSEHSGISSKTHRKLALRGTGIATVVRRHPGSQGESNPVKLSQIIFRRKMATQDSVFKQAGPPKGRFLERLSNMFLKVHCYNPAIFTSYLGECVRVSSTGQRHPALPAAHARTPILL